MPAVVPIAIAAGSALGSIGAAKIGSNASKRAADQQTQANREALDFEKQVYANDLADYEGLKGAGNQALVRLGDLLTQPRTPATAAGVMGAGQVPGMTTIAQLRSGGAGPPAAGLVRMQAPDGEVRMVQPNAVAKYEARGARRL